MDPKIEARLRELEDLRIEVRERAAEELARAGAAAVPGLKALLSSPYDDVKSWAGEVLKRIEGAGVAVAIDASSLPAAIESLLGNHEGAIAQATQVLASLVERSVAAPKESLDALVEVIRRPTHGRQRELAQELVVRAGRAGAEALARAQKKRHEPMTFDALLRCGAEGFAAIAPLVDDPDPRVRREAIDDLWRFGAPAEARLLTLLDHRDADVRTHAAWSLGNLGRQLPEAQERIARALAERFTPELNGSLAKQGEPALPHIVALLGRETDVARVRGALTAACMWAEHGKGTRRSPELVAAIERFLSHAELDGRLDAAAAHAALAGEGAGLELLLREYRGERRDLIGIVLDRLGRRPRPQRALFEGTTKQYLERLAACGWFEGLPRTAKKKSASASIARWKTTRRSRTRARCP